MEIDGQGACTTLNSPPLNVTDNLLDSSLDFVNGSFARMVRSYAMIDPTPTRGYQDVLLFLALEDVQGLAALNTPLLTATGGAAGDRLRFFVGMAHLKPIRSSNRLVVSSSQVEINADITTSYQYTTQTSTDFTFIRDVRVQLSEVKLAGAPEGASTIKFATITIIVPDTLTQADAVNIIPPLSLKVGVGFNSDQISFTNYPCVQTYSGANKDAIDAMLLAQKECALQDPICSAQGPVPIGPGGSIEFTFPLDDQVWNATQLDDDSLQLRESIFIDFMVSAVDANGKRLITNLQTSTVLKRSSILSRCTDQLVDASISEILTIDMFLGLVGDNASFSESLVQNLDVTRQITPTNMRRDISSKASNVMTMLIKGDDSLFAQNFAQEYTLAVEDVITLHFLDKTKLASVQSMINLDTAFRQVTAPTGTLRFAFSSHNSFLEFKKISQNIQNTQKRTNFTRISIENVDISMKFTLFEEVYFPVLLAR